jgi:Dullard-like phosphatase family protein
MDENVLFTCDSKQASIEKAKMQEKVEADEGVDLPSTSTEKDSL